MIVAVLVVATTWPVTTPVLTVTVAIAVLLLLHVPPPASLNVVVSPEQTVRLPKMAVGSGSTVTTAVIKQPVDDNVYVIVVVPTVPPFTIPVADPIVALVLLLVHVPPPVASLNVVVSPKHTLRSPSIAVGTGFTVTTAVALQPVPIV